MSLFKNQVHLVDTAIGLVTDRLSALEKDVDHCLNRPYSPLPAIAYCFSTIDLLGALYKGDASSAAKTSHNARAYLVDLMHYTDDQATILQRIFRHKIIHLAMPKSVIEYNGKMIGWKYCHQNRKEHLLLCRLPKTQQFSINTRWGTILSLNYHYEFIIGIKDLEIDITNSVTTASGYFSALKSNKDLQTNFERALKQMYDPAD